MITSLPEKLIDWGLPVLTGLIGWFFENWRQTRNSKRELMLQIETRLKNIIEKTEEVSPSKNALRFECTSTFHDLKIFCKKYRIDFLPIREQFTELVIYATGDQFNAKEVANISISLLNTLKK